MTDEPNDNIRLPAEAIHRLLIQFKNFFWQFIHFVWPTKSPTIAYRTDPSNRHMNGTLIRTDSFSDSDASSELGLHTGSESTSDPESEEEWEAAARFTASTPTRR